MQPVFTVSLDKHHSGTFPTSSSTVTHLTGRPGGKSCHSQLLNESNKPRQQTDCRTTSSKRTLIITISQHNLTQGRIAAAHGRFNHIHQLAQMCTPVSHMCFLGLTGVHIQHGISIASAIFAQCKFVTDRQTDRQTMLPRL